MSANNLSAADKTRQAARQMMRLAADKTKIATARTMKGETHEIDIAVVKATAAQFHVVPKEKHVRTLKNAVHPARPRREVQYVISELMHRLHHANDWLTALKTLMVVHRLMRESNISLVEELLKYSETTTQGKGHVLNMDNFIDTTNIEGRFEFSEWVRAYGKYLDEQLEVYQRINFYQEQEHSGEQSRLRGLSATDLLFQMPFLQTLLQRLLDCRPSGAASHDAVVQQSLLTVLKESFKVYKAISEGLINLADRFFEMEYLDAHKGLEVYKESILANERLQQYYQQVEQIEELRRTIQFPKLESPPADFLAQMEAYAKEAPRPYDEASGVAGSKKKSPPLRKGTRARAGGQGHADIAPSELRADPGMVLNYKPQEQAAPAAAQPAPDLLDFDGLSMDGPPAAAQAAAPRQGGGASSYTDLLSEMPEVAPAVDPHAASNGNASTGFGGNQPASNQFGGNQFGAQQNGPPQPAGHNPFGAPSAGPPASNPFSNPPSGYQGSFNQPSGAYGQPPNGYSQPQQGYSQPSGGQNQTSQGYSQAPQGYNQTPGGYGQPTQGYGQSQGGFSQGSNMQSGFGAAQGQGSSQQGFQGGFGNDAGFGGQQAPMQTPPKLPTKKEAAALHDPFAALTGLSGREDSKPSPPLRASPANSYTAGQPSHGQAYPSNLSSGVPSAGLDGRGGGIGRGGTPVVPGYDGGNQNTGAGGSQFPQAFASGNAAGPPAGMRAGPNSGAGNATVSVGPAAPKAAQQSPSPTSFASQNGSSLI